MEWEELLKGKLRDSQKEKNSIEEEFIQYKMTTKLKIKGLKEEFSRKLE